MPEEKIQTFYKEILEKYIKENDEQSLYQGQQLIRQMIEDGVSPEEVVHLHVMGLLQIYPTLNEEMKRSFKFLLEVMMGYGIAYREHQSLKDKQKLINLEMGIAKGMQTRFLKREVPNVDFLDIGVISQAASQVNGDYYHFEHDIEGRVSVVIADVIGKGIPALLCMSMIRYAIETFPPSLMNPAHILENINNVFERNLDDSMFITMFYGQYDANAHRFIYANAGHEPGFIYRNEADQFQEIKSKGVMLGVQKDAKYTCYETEINLGDFIILLSDGVTEARFNGKFVDRNDIFQIIRKYKTLPAQEIVNKVYFELEKRQNFELKDDMTLIILRRNV